ncbi:MAG: glycosyltransferase family 4 protein [Anaerolineales bacterium]|nr:glycosyltransferase family 4 protein [Anaerolineales bacterium]
MNVLYTLTAYPPFWGGAQLLIHGLARQLRREHAVQVVSQWDTPRSDWLLGTTLNAPLDTRAYVVDGVPVRRIGLPHDVRAGLKPWVYGYWAAQGPAIERISAVLADRFADLAGAADLIHNCRIGREPLTAASLALARRRDIPFVLSPVHHPRWGSWLHRHYQRLYRAADAIVALTRGERDLLLDLGVDERKIAITGMGPDLAPTGDGAAFRAAHGLGQDPVVLFVGQKYAYKGVAALLNATRRVWERVPETRFVFIGRPTRETAGLFRDLDRRIVNLDGVDLQTKTDAYAACDVFCLPSTQESFGGVFTEAWTFGKPVIGADIAAVSDVIDDAVNGFICPPAAGPLADHLVHLLLNPGLRARFGEAGRRKVAERYTWPAIAARTEALYRSLLAGAEPAATRTVAVPAVRPCEETLA